jgi:hypothetical protein
MRTSELKKGALDWAVAKCEGHDVEDSTWWADFGGESQYSTDWAQGGTIIEREGIGIWMYQWNEQGEPEVGWYAEDKDGDHVQTGTTPLKAAMRCYVASKLGDEVELPEELNGQV